MFLISCMWACKKSGSPEIKLSWTYSGTFKRYVGISAPAAAVQITFSGNTFTGESDSLHYPDICHGNYEIIQNNQDSISFKNLCFFPANFPWSLVLSGQYKMVQKGDSLYISRLFGDFVYEEDVYSLRRQ